MAKKSGSAQWMQGDGDVRARLRALDWSGSPLGPPDDWPQQLATVLNLMLNSKFPMFVAWGPELAFLYNDNYAHIMGDKHPAGLGQPFRTVWSEIWPVISPIAEAAMAGNSSYFEDLPLDIMRDGAMQRAWFTFSYSPLQDNDGIARGMYCAVVETTANVEAGQVQSFMLELSDRLRELSSGEEIIAAASELLGHSVQGSRVLYAEIDDKPGSFSIRRDWHSEGTASVAGLRGRLDDFGARIGALLRAGATIVAGDVRTDERTRDAAGVYLDIGVQACILVPLVKSGRLTSVLSVHCAQARLWRPNEVRMAQEMAERTWSALESAQAQADLRDANRRKDEFLAMLAHELRNPLAPVSSAAALLELAPHDAARVRQSSAIISRQVRHMTGLVDDLLDVSRVTRGQITISRLAHDMKDIIASALEQVDPIIRARGHHLALDLADGPAPILGDENRLVQVLANLLNNAAKYTNDGGHLRVTLATSAEQVLVSVADNGIGIAPNLQARVFDLFAQADRSSDRSQGGLGLGLALVRSLVQLHGGEATCESAGPGRGSCFTVRLPRHAAAPGHGALPAAAPAAAAQAGQVILVVDDNVDAAAMLGMLLDASGHQVLVEHSPAQALARTPATRPTACILDIGLPGMDGYELARRLRRQEGMEHALLIAVTGYGQQGDRQKALAAGFDAHLVKPVDLDALLRILERNGRAPHVIGSNLGSNLGINSGSNPGSNSGSD